MEKKSTPEFEYPAFEYPISLKWATDENGNKHMSILCKRSAFNTEERFVY